MTTITLPTDAVATVPLLFTDQVGRPVAPPAGGSVSTDNSGVANATVAADDSSITITPGANGAATVNYTNGELTTSATVTVVAPVATAVAFGAPTFAGTP